MLVKKSDVLKTSDFSVMSHPDDPDDPFDRRELDTLLSTPKISPSVEMT